MGPFLTRRAFVAASGLLSLGMLASCTPADVASSQAGVEEAADTGSRVVVMDPVAPVDPETPEDATTTATLSMVGDVLVHEGVWASGDHGDGTYSFDHLFAQVAPLVHAADVALVNQETILGGTSLGLSGYPLFNSPQEIGDAEAQAGFSMVCSATNHALDKGYEGIANTVGFWQGSHPDVTCLGIALDEEHYDQVHVREVNGIRVAVLNYASSTNGIAFPEEDPYAVSMLSRSKVEKDVACAREAADVVIVCPHWGTEYSQTSDENQRYWADVLCSAGVDVVIGTHPHVLEPVEVVTGDDGHTMVVFWSIGNFMSWQRQAACMVGGMASVTFERDSSGTRLASCSLTPLVTHEAQGTELTTYRLADYTDELAGANAITNADGCSDFSVRWCRDLCAGVLGDGWDETSCTWTMPA
jgi:poly-gamma-glutamate synthesis protein (capsule biosynthesis protein)